jgi:two-component system sensor histidine kinase MtrB
MSLRRAFLVFATALGLLGVTAAGGLILFTTALHRTTATIEDAVESVRIAEEFEIELLSHRATPDTFARISIEGRLRQRLLDAAHFVGSAEEEALLGRTRTELEAYLEAFHRAPATEQFLSAPQDGSDSKFEAVFASSRELIQINVEQSRALRHTAAAWDRTANILGTAIIVFFVGGLAALGLFIQRAVFGPAVSIAAAVDRYTKGDRTSRASEEGVAEFRTIAHRFNGMASTIERQREHQMAFLAGVAHDIRNPLSALKLASAIISADRPLPPEDRIRQSYTRVQRQINHLERMVFDFLDAALIEAGRLELQLEACDVRDIARATIDLFEPTAPTHRLSLTAPSDPVQVICDPARIEQVLNNLVSNAIKYSPRGGQVTVVIEPQDDAVLLSVSDEGVGMSAGELEHIFDPFRRTGATAESVPGTGLGLFVARRIMESHGGRITLESAPGNGSTFRLQLPTRSSAISAAESAKLP